MLTTAHVDLVALIEQHAPTRLTRTATSAGGEYHGPCPFCKAGTDRFFVQPHHATRPHYHCRQCGRTGDAVQFLRDFVGMSFIEACEELGLDAGVESGLIPHPSLDPDIPCKEWQARAEEFVFAAQKMLFSPKGADMLSYLHKRGFTDATIQAARLGYCPVWYHDSLEAWGISLSQTPKSQVTIPPGIIIPWTADGVIWKLAVKRPGQTPDYGQVVGSCEGLYLADTLARNAPCVLVEGEFDALSIWQECPHVAVCATGSTTRARTPRWLSHLALCSPLLIAYDADEAGDTGADYWLATFPSQSRRWRPWAHDPNDMLSSSLSLSEWLNVGLGTTRKPLARNEPPPPPTPLSPAPAVPPPPMRATLPGQSPYPTQSCRFCKCPVQWVWSSLDTDWICLCCLSPSVKPVLLW